MTLTLTKVSIERKGPKVLVNWGNVSMALPSTDTLGTVLQGPSLFVCVEETLEEIEWMLRQEGELTTGIPKVQEPEEEEGFAPDPFPD